MSIIDPRWLSSTVIDIATVIMNIKPADRTFNFGDRLSILADALQDAGCDNETMIADLMGHGERFGILVRQDEIVASICREAAIAAGKIVYRCTWPVYDQHGRYGSGGWSSKAKHRPLPRWETVETTDVVCKGKSVIVDGTRRLKLNITNAATGEVIRNDYQEAP